MAPTSSAMHEPAPSPVVRRRRVLQVLWPSFVMAGVLEMLVFVVVDPGSLHGLGVEPLGWSNATVYSIAFLLFWAVIALSTLISLWLSAWPPEG